MSLWDGEYWPHFTGKGLEAHRWKVMQLAEVVKSQFPAPCPFPHLCVSSGSTNNARLHIPCISIYNIYKSVCFHPLFLGEVELLSQYLYCFSLNKKKNATEPFKKTLSSTDAIYLSSSEMINGITGALGEGYLYECLSWPIINSIAFSISADHRKMQNGHSICTLISPSPCVFIKW